MTTDRRQTAPRSDMTGYLVLAFVCFHVLEVAWGMRTYVMDDAYIGLRYVDNLQHGQGFVFNPGERVEGVTNAGWLLVLALVGRLLPLVTAAKVAGLVLLLCAVALCYLVALRLAGPDHTPLFAVTVPLLVATQPDLLLFSLVGMETALLALVLCLGAWVVVTDRSPVLLGALGAVGYLLHPESVLVYPLMLGLLWFTDRTRVRRQLWGLAAFAALLVAFTVARYLYYGELLPNTLRAKVTTPVGLLFSVQRLLTGQNTNVASPFAGLLALPVLVYGVAAMGRESSTARAYLGAVVATGIAFCTYAPVDWTGSGRYLAPYTPILMIVFWYGLIAIHVAVLRACGRERHLPAVVMA